MSMSLRHQSDFTSLCFLFAILKITIYYIVTKQRKTVKVGKLNSISLEYQGVLPHTFKHLMQLFTFPKCQIYVMPDVYYNKIKRKKNNGPLFSFQ